MQRQLQKACGPNNVVRGSTSAGWPALRSGSSMLHHNASAARHALLRLGRDLVACAGGSSFLSTPPQEAPTGLAGSEYDFANARSRSVLLTLSGRLAADGPFQPCVTPHQSTASAAGCRGTPIATPTQMSMVPSSPSAMGMSVTSGSTGMALGTRTCSTH